MEKEDTAKEETEAVPEEPVETEDIIRVVGTFDTYYEGDMMYCILRNAYYAD